MTNQKEKPQENLLPAYLGLLAAASIVTGVGLISRPAAFIAFGVFCLVAAVGMYRTKS